MDQLFNIGKSIFSGGSQGGQAQGGGADQLFNIGANIFGGNNNNGGGALGMMGNAFQMFQQFDRNNDGKITEDGFFFC